ncbi:MAG: flagellar motor protein MotB [Myxococcota bacterium]|jgi:flagellar motor protein MotB
MGVILLSMLGCATINGEARQQDLIYQLDREVIALKLRNKQLQVALEGCGDTQERNPIHAELLQVFAGSEVIVSRSGAQTIVVIPGAFLFSSGSTTIRSEATMVLDLLSVALNLHTDAQIRVIGHTDDRPLSGSLKRQYGSNWELSVFRASSFMHTMAADFGIDMARFTIAGRGPSQPIATNDTPEGRERNRRLIVIIGPEASGL